MAGCRGSQNPNRRSGTCSRRSGSWRWSGIFSARVSALSRGERLAMMDRNGALSIRRQCALLGISRSSAYYRPRGESRESLALMRQMVRHLPERELFSRIDKSEGTAT